MTKEKIQAVKEAYRYGYSDESWGKLEEKERQLLRKISPAPRAAYKVNMFLNRIEGWLADEEAGAKLMGGTFSLIPDFQRGHVWDEAKQAAYVENYLRGQAPALFRFNNVSITGSSREAGGDIQPYDMVCIDGLQRLTALREFMADRLTVFGDIKASDLRGTVVDPKRTIFNFELEVFAFPWRHELLDYYVALNAGGVVHSPEEIARVKAMSETARLSSLPAPKPETAKRRRNPSS